MSALMRSLSQLMVVSCRERFIKQRESSTKEVLIDLPPQPSPLSMLGLRAYFR